MIYLSETNLGENSNPFFNLEQDEIFLKVSWIVTQVLLKFSPKADIFYKNKERICLGEILKFFCSKKNREFRMEAKGEF